MNKSSDIKAKLYSACLANIDQRIDTLMKTLDSIAQSRNNETKSSAGDKYETGRAMMQMEEDKARSQLLRANQVKSELNRIDPTRKTQQVEIGSLIVTDKGRFFISIGIGKVTVQDQLYYCLSIHSPIGKMLKGKEVGDEFVFNGMNYTLKEIY